MKNADLFNYRGSGIATAGLLRVNTQGAAGVNTSMHRGRTFGGSKINLGGYIFDLIFENKGKFSAYISDDAEKNIYLVHEDGTKYLRTENGYYYKEGTDFHRRFHAVPEVMHQLHASSNSELINTFKNMCADYKLHGNYALDDLYLFCDSFYYYGCTRSLPEDMDMPADMEAQLEAGVRSGLYKSLANFYPEGTMKDSAKVAATRKPRKKKSDEKSFIKACKEGLYRISYEWPEALKGFIKSPDYLDTFETTPEFEEIVKKIKFRADRILERMDMGYTGAEAIGKDALNILLLGKPGTGKTALAYALSAATGMPVCTTAWNKHSEEGEVEGKSRIVDGKPAFVETDSLMFHQCGGIDINEEINLADPSVTMGCLGQKLEYPFIVKKNGFETVVRHPLNVIIGTMNVGTNGSNPLNQALANRFNTPYILDDPTRDTFINILQKITKESEDVCTWVYDAYDAAVNYLKSPDVNEDEICQNLSIRTCVGAIENLEEGQSPQRALVNSIVGAVAVVDLEVARNLQKECIENLAEPSFSK